LAIGEWRSAAGDQGSAISNHQAAPTFTRRAKSNLDAMLVEVAAPRERVLTKAVAWHNQDTEQQAPGC
jgi:hypothetical protein